MENNVTSSPDYKVTKKTANLLDCIKTANLLYEQIYDSLSVIYGDAQTDKTIIGPYEEALHQIRERLFKEVNGQMMKGLTSEEGNTI